MLGEQRILELGGSTEIIISKAVSSSWGEGCKSWSQNVWFSGLDPPLIRNKPQANDLTFVCLNLLICKMGMIIESALSGS